MVDKCPKCQETLITRSIQKKMGLGSIDLPVAQICPKCNWSKDLTGAGDIVVKPPVAAVPEKEMEKKTEVIQTPAKTVPSPAKTRPLKEKTIPEKPKPELEKAKQKPGIPAQSPADMNRLITIILALLVIAGIIWTFLPKGGSQAKDLSPVPTPDITAAATPISAPTVNPEITPTGNMIKVKIDRDRGYISAEQKNLKINPGDEVVWMNDGSYSLTLVSNDGLFEDKLLDNEKQTSYIFKKTGTYTFDIMVRGVKKFSGTVTV